MEASSNSPNVWPGYVAATAGLAITLLLMIAILGGNLFVIGQTAAQHADAEPVAPTPPEPVLASVDAPPQAAQAEADGRADGDMPLLPPLDAGNERILLSFEPQAYVIEDSIREAVGRELASAPAGSTIRIVGLVDSASTAASHRAAFIRVMAVRNALMDLLIEAPRLQPSLRVLEKPASGRNAPWAGGGAVLIEFDGVAKTLSPASEVRHAQQQ